MLVKCQNCGNKIERNEAYKVTNNKVNKYYCTKQEYLEIINKQTTKDEVYIHIENIFGYKSTHTSLFKEISEIANSYTYEKIKIYLQANQEYLSRIMKKDFTTEYGRIRYFSTVLKNNLMNFIPQIKEENKVLDVDIPKDNYKPKTRQKTLVEYEIEVGENK